MPGIDTISATGNTAILQEAAIPAVPASRQPDRFSNTMNKKLHAPSNLDSIFEDASRQYQVPVSLLKAVAKAESDFNPGAVSKAGAQGIMQLMPGTARELGVTDSFDPRQNIMGGAKYLRRMLDKYDGDTKLALAAYNAGSNNVDKYGGVPPFKETQNYVVKVMQYTGADLSAAPNTGAGRQTGIVSGPNIRYSNYGTSDQSLCYQAILQSILDFHEFSADDYLLFLELVKCSLQTADTESTMEDSGNYFQNPYYGSRIQNLF